MNKIFLLCAIGFFIGSCIPEKSGRNQQLDSDMGDSSGLVQQLLEKSDSNNIASDSKNIGEDYTLYYTEGGTLFPSLKERMEAFSNIKKQTPIPTTSFTINPARDTVIIGSQGTSFFIEAYCFEKETGKPINKPVKLTLQEFYSYSDMLKAGLTTRSNGNILETAGMFCLEGSGSDSAIKIRKGYSIMVSPASSIDSDFDFYTSETLPNGEINWEIDTTAKEEPLIIVPVECKYSNVIPISEYIVAHYRLPKNSMSILRGEIWSCNMNAYNGKLIGFGGVSEDNKTIENAIGQYKKIAPAFYSQFYNTGYMKAIERNTNFSFKALTRSEYLFSIAESSLFSTFSKFQKTAKVYKQTGKAAIFVMNALGTFNFDRVPVLAGVINTIEDGLESFVKTVEVDQGPLRTIAVKQKDLPNPIRTVIVLKDIRSILSTRETKEGFICEGIPEKSNGLVLVTAVKEDKYFLGIGTLSAGKSNEIYKLDKIMSFASVEEYSKELEKIAGSIDKRKK